MSQAWLQLMQGRPRASSHASWQGPRTASHPSRAAARFAKAAQLHQAGRIVEAAAGYKAVLAIEPSHAFAHHNLGAIFDAQGRLDKAAAEYRRALAANPQLAETHYSLAAIYRVQGKLEEAIAHLRRTIELQPSLAGAHRDLGGALQGHALAVEQRLMATARMGQTDVGRIDQWLKDAADCYRRAIALKPDYAEAYNDLGSVLQTLCEPGQAAAAFQHATKLRPDYAEAHNNLAAALIEQGRLAEAETCCRRALALRPELVQAWYNLGRVHRGQGRLDDAVAALQRTLALKPDLIGAHRALGETRRARGESDAALLVAWNEIRLAFGKEYCERVAEPTSIDPILDRIDDALPPALRPRDAAIWIFDRAQIVGHLSLEPFHFRNVFAKLGRPMIAIMPPRARQPLANRAILDIAFRDFTVVESADPTVLGLASRNIGVIERGGKTYALCSYDMLARAYFRHRRDGKPVQFHALSPDEIVRGAALAQRLGVGDDAKVIVIHMRGAGFHRHRVVAHSFRNVTVENYLPAIRRLADRGFHVVRIGDRSMTPLPDTGPRVIDAPFLADYDALIDPYFIARSSFMISCNSGPCSLARAFGRPCLVLNAPVNPTFIPEAFELLAFKKYVDHEGGGARPLSYAEILQRRLQDVYSTAGFADNGIELRELTADEILATTEEMIDRQSVDNAAAEDAAFHALSATEDARRAADPGARVRMQDWFGYTLPAARISTAYCALNSGFLSVP
jgi:putative glycosyltransferase (TIGR04372 family)